MLKNKRKWTIDARISYPLSNYLAGSYVTGLPFSKRCRKFGPERKGNRIFFVSFQWKMERLNSVFRVGIFQTEIIGSISSNQF